MDAQYDNLVAELNEQNNYRVNHVPPRADLIIEHKDEYWGDEGYYSAVTLTR